ncbi:MAG: hypothetical protein ACM3XN_09975 [Chloroflexota bacterium]
MADLQSSQVGWGGGWFFGPGRWIFIAVILIILLFFFAIVSVPGTGGPIW